MPRTICIILVVILPVMAGLDIAWMSIVHIEADTAIYTEVGFLTGLLWSGAAVFHYKFRNESAAVALFGLGYILAFSIACSTFTYLAITLTGYRIDDFLARLDRSIGFDWIGLMRFVSFHPAFLRLLRSAYNWAIWQPVLLIIWAGLRGRPDVITKFLIAISFATLITTLFWMAFPSFGAYSVYTLPADVAARMHDLVDADYGHRLAEILNKSTGHIKPFSLKGLIGFPSFHTIESLLIVIYLRPWKVLLVPAAIFNAAAIAATPIHGGHHVMDVFGGIAATALSVYLSQTLVRWAQAREALSS